MSVWVEGGRGWGKNGRQSTSLHHKHRPQDKEAPKDEVAAQSKRKRDRLGCSCLLRWASSRYVAWCFSFYFNREQRRETDGSYAHIRHPPRQGKLLPQKRQVINTSQGQVNPLILSHIFFSFLLRSALSSTPRIPLGR